MRRAILYISLIALVSIFTIPAIAKNKKPIKPQFDKVYLVCNALTTTYDYSALRGSITGELSKESYVIVRSAKEADWTVQVTAVPGATQKTDFGTASFYTTEINATIIIDRGAYGERVFEVTYTEKGKHPIGFDEAAIEAYSVLTPQICQTIIQYIR